MSKEKHWQPKYTAGQLIKMGKFKDAIELFSWELQLALKHGVVKSDEIFGPFGLLAEFSNILLNPSDFERVQKLGDSLIMLETRIPNYLRPVSKEEYYKNVKLNYETIDPKDK